jgi:GNAT superfamily N-acetyltransferase
MSAPTDKYGGDIPRNEGSTTHYPALGCHACPASFFSNERHAAHIRSAHPDSSPPASWESGDHRVEYHPNLTPAHPHLYLLSDKQSGKYLSNMVLNREGRVDAVETHPKFRRQGLATKLWSEAQQHAEDFPAVPAPQHSTSRTRAGDSWAKKVGGDVPPVSRFLSARQMRGMIDFKRQ